MTDDERQGAIAIMNSLAQQRNDALNREAHRIGEIAILQAQLATAQERLAKLEAAMKQPATEPTTGDKATAQPVLH